MQFYHQNITPNGNMYPPETVLSANLLQSVIFTQYSFTGFPPGDWISDKVREGVFGGVIMKLV